MILVDSMRTNQHIAISTKMTILAGSLLLPTAVLIYDLVRTIQKSIEATRIELVENAAQRPLAKLMDGVQRAELTLAICLQRPGCGREADFSRRKTALVFASFRNSDENPRGAEAVAVNNVDAAQEQTIEISRLVTEWNQLQHYVSASPEQLAGYERLNASLATMMRRGAVSATSPEWVSRHLGDASFIGIPQAQDRLAQLMVFGSEMIAQGHASAAELSNLAMESAQLNDGDFQRTIDNVGESLDETSMLSTDAH